MRAGRKAVSAGNILPNKSRRPFSESAGGVAARRLAASVCFLDELSAGKSSSDDWRVGGRHLYLLSLEARDPMDAGAVVVRADWLALPSPCRSTRSW
jgi:hypothetical protein